MSGDLIARCRAALAASDETAKAATPGPWTVRIEGGRDCTDESGGRAVTEPWSYVVACLVGVLAGILATLSVLGKLG